MPWYGLYQKLAREGFARHPDHRVGKLGLVLGPRSPPTGAAGRSPGCSAAGLFRPARGRSSWASRGGSRSVLEPAALTAIICRNRSVSDATLVRRLIRLHGRVVRSPTRWPRAAHGHQNRGNITTRRMVGKGLAMGGALAFLSPHKSVPSARRMYAALPGLDHPGPSVRATRRLSVPRAKLQSGAGCPV